MPGKSPTQACLLVEHFDEPFADISERQTAHVISYPASQLRLPRDPPSHYSSSGDTQRRLVDPLQGHLRLSAPGWRPCRQARTVPPTPPETWESSEQLGRIKVSKCRGLSMSFPPTRSGSRETEAGARRRDTGRAVARKAASCDIVVRQTRLCRPWVSSLSPAASDPFLHDPRHAGTRKPGG